MVLTVVPNPNKKGKKEKKESKDVADIETRRNQQRFPCMSHCPAFGINFTSLIGAHFFGTIAFMEICPENPVPKALHFSVAPSLRSSPPAISTLPTQLSPSYFHVLDPQFFGTIAFIEFVLKTRCQKLCILVPLPPHAALPQLFPPSLRSSPPAISTSWTHSFSEQSH